MFIDQALLTIIFDYDSEIVEADDLTLEWYPVREVNGYVNFIFSNFVEQYVLNIIFHQQSLFGTRSVCNTIKVCRRVLFYRIIAEMPDYGQPFLNGAYF